MAQLSAVLGGIANAEVSSADRRMLMRYAVLVAMGSHLQQPDCDVIGEAADFQATVEQVLGKPLGSPGRAFAAVRPRLTADLRTRAQRVVRSRNSMAHPPRADPELAHAIRTHLANEPGLTPGEQEDLLDLKAHPVGGSAQQLARKAGSEAGATLDPSTCSDSSATTTSVGTIDVLLDKPQGQEHVLSGKIHNDVTGDSERLPDAARTLAHKADGHQHSATMADSSLPEGAETSSGQAEQHTPPITDNVPPKPCMDKLCQRNDNVSTHKGVDTNEQASRRGTPTSLAGVHTADPSPAGATSARHAVRCRLVALFMQHSPANIRNVDALLDQHQGQELVLFEMLFRQFNGTGDIERHPAAASTLAHRADGHQQSEVTAAQAGPSATGAQRLPAVGHAAPSDLPGLSGAARRDRRRQWPQQACRC